LQYFKGVDVNSVESLKVNKQYLGGSSDLEKKMMQNSKLLKLLDANLRVTKSKLDSTIAEAKPRLSLSASTTAPAKDLKDDLVANVGLLVNYTFSDGGKNIAEIKTLQLQAKALDLRKVETKIEMKTSLELLLQEQRAGAIKQAALIDLVKLAKEVRDTAKAQLVSGRSKIEDVMTAEVALAETKIDLIKTKSDLQVKSMQIETLVSGLIETLGWTPY
jgi:outer membrane protein TolC